MTREVKPSPEYFPALTGLRFFLAIWVVLHHLVSRGMMLEAWSLSLPPAMALFLDEGHVAVRSFFVLSGFVLAQGYARSCWTRRDLISYGVARVARVYPVYLLSLFIILYFILQYLASPRFTAEGKFEMMTSYALVLQGWMRSPGAGWNTPAWSLSCEFVFYLSLPLILLWLGPRNPVRLAVLTSAALVLPIVLRRMGVPQNWKPILHLGDFLIGIAAARVYSALKSTGRLIRRGYWLYLPAISAGVAAILSRNFVETFTDLGTVLRPLNAMLVIGLALGGGACVKFLSTEAAQYLGQASYSLYILHIPLLWWFGNRGPLIFGRLEGGVALIYMIAIVLVSCACFEWFEKPTNRWIRDWSRRSLLGIRERPPSLRSAYPGSKA